MNIKIITDIINKKLNDILILENSRGIEDKDLLKLLLKYQLLFNGLILEIPIEEFENCVEADNKNKILIVNINKYNIIIKKIQEIINNILGKMGYNVSLEYKGYFENFKKVVLTENISELLITIKYSFIEIELLSNIDNDNYILKDNLNPRFYSGNTSQYNWSYKEVDAKIFSNLEDIAKLIIDNNFTNVKLIKYTVSDMEKAQNKEIEREIENTILMDPNDIEWFNSIEYNYWMNMSHEAAINGWFTGRDNQFLMNIGKLRQNSKIPSYKQFKWVKDLFKRYNELI